MFQRLRALVLEDVGERLDVDAVQSALALRVVHALFEDVAPGGPGGLGGHESDPPANPAGVGGLEVLEVGDPAAVGHDPQATSLTLGGFTKGGAAEVAGVTVSKK